MLEVLLPSMFLAWLRGDEKRSAFEFTCIIPHFRQRLGWFYSAWGLSLVMGKFCCGQTHRRFTFLSCCCFAQIIYFKMWGEANCLCFNVLFFQHLGEKTSTCTGKKNIWIEIRDILFRKCKSKTNRISGCYHYPSRYWNVLLYLLLVPIAGDIGKCAVCSNIALQKRIPELAGWRPDWCSWAETTPGNCSFVCLVDGDRRGGGIEEHTWWVSMDAFWRWYSMEGEQCPGSWLSSWAAVGCTDR